MTSEEYLQLKNLAKYYALSELGVDTEEDEVPVEQMQNILEILDNTAIQSEFQKLIEKYKEELPKKRKEKEKKKKEDKDEMSGS